MNAKDATYAQLFPPKPGRGEQTKLRIVRAAIECLAKDGIEKLTFESVGKRIGINRAQVKYHFAEKEELIDKAIDYVIATAQKIVIERLAKSNHWKSQIKAIVDGFFDWVEKYPDQGSVLFLLYYSATFNSKRREFHTKMTEMGFNRTYSVLLGAQKEMGWDTGEVKSLSLSVWALTDGLMLYHLSTKPRKDRQFFRKEASRIVNLLLRS